ncbi:dihydroorotase [Naganishia albida]|nr:dihydroorotase [Naganishia albida]
MTTGQITIPAPADFHVHLRQGAMSELVTPHVALGGIKTAYVMPNLTPPITSAEQAISYKQDLQKLAPETEFLMTLYLHENMLEEIDVDGKKVLRGVQEVRKASRAGVRGIKSYPRGVTTNSSSGIESYEPYYPVFKALEEEGMVLNLHGEVPSDDEKNISVLNAEKHFLQHLRKLATDFPKLKIVLEHATTKEAVDCVKSLPDNVGCTITPHHLVLTIDAVPSQPFNFCKPIAKEPVDRKALLDVVASGHPRFFLGSDSAPHPIKHKVPKLPDTSPCAAGVYTSPVLLLLVAYILEKAGALDKLVGFTSSNGRAFYGLPVEENDRPVTLRRVKGKAVPAFYKGSQEGVDIVPFMAGEELGWEIAA